MNEFIEQFLLESRELVEQATADLLAVEENPGDSERLDGAFRAFHTLKGSAGIVDFSAMVQVSHAVEDMLASVRAGKAAVSRELISDCLGALDLILQWLDVMQASGEIPLTAAAQGDALVARFSTAPAQGGPGEPVAKSAPGWAAQGGLSASAVQLLAAQLRLLEVKSEVGLVGRLLAAGRVAVNVLRSTGLENKVAALEAAAGASGAAEDPARLAEAIAALLPAGATAPEGAGQAASADVSARVLRVDVARIDTLVKLTGELGVAKNAIGHAAQLAREQGDPQVLARLLKDQHGVLERLMGELQRSVLSIRVLPLRHVFNRFPKLVREIAETVGKDAKLVTVGDDTEADKVVVENLFEPLLHIVRNALDHGIEPPAERENLGKPAVATIEMRATRNGDVVLVEVEDDGRGIDVKRVRDLAIERGVISQEAAAEMDQARITDLIFAPGFSTATSVSSLSGRGVGMDVVRRAIEALGGTAHVDSRAGAGTRVTLRVPFSVLMTRIMTVKAGGQIFGIPLEAVAETAHIPRGQVSPIGKSHAFVLRDRTIPLVGLAHSVGQPVAAGPSPTARIVVVSLDGELGGIEVDEFGEQFDVMLKPLDGLLSGMPGVAGTSLLGTGEVLIVLDLVQLLH